MKILALTDIHGKYRLAEQILRTESPDILIIGGDLTTVGSVAEAEQALAAFQSYTSNVVCVAGNMDTPDHDTLFIQSGVSINGRGVILDGVGFFGVSGAPHSPLHTPNEISEQEITRLAEKGWTEIQDATVKIFVPHAPPYGTQLDVIHSGAHVGSTAVRNFVEQTQPDGVVCGHIHEARGQGVLGKTRIINCGTASHGYYAVLTVSQNRLQIIPNQLVI